MVVVETSLDWTRTRLKNVATINGRSLSAETANDYTFRYLEISKVNGRGIISDEAISEVTFGDAPSRARRIVRDGDSVISSVRPNLQAIAFIENAAGDFVASTGFFVVSPLRHKLDDKFSYYLLLSDASRQYFEAGAKGVGYPAIDDKDFGTLKFRLPPLAEQRRIGAYLDNACAAIDGAIRAKRKQLEVLDDLRKSIIHKAVTRGLDEDVKLRDSSVQWLNQNPRHWKTARLKDVVMLQLSITLGKQYSGPLVEKPYLRVANVQDGFLNLNEITTIELPESEAARSTLRAGDVLMTEGGDLDKLGRGYMWEGQIPDCLHQNHIFVVRCDHPKLKPEFLTFLTSSNYGRAYFESTGKRTTNLASTNATKIKSFPILLPPIVEQEAIVSFLQYRDRQTKSIKDNLNAQIATLEQYRRSLIHECVTGKRRIE